MKRRKSNKVNVCPWCDRSMDAQLVSCSRCGTSIPKDSDLSARIPGVADERTYITTIGGPRDYMHERIVK